MALVLFALLCALAAAGNIITIRHTGERAENREASTLCCRGGWLPSMDPCLLHSLYIVRSYATSRNVAVVVFDETRTSRDMG